MDVEKIFITGVVVFFVSLVIGITAYNMKEIDLISKAIEDGANPIEAYCAFNGVSSGCLVGALKKD